MRILSLAAALLFATPAFADVAPPPPDEAEGTWYGTMTQYEAGRQTSYPMRVVFDGDAGLTDYPKLKCGGELSRLGETNGYVTYQETITRGAFDEKKGSGCIDGLLTVRLEGDKLYLGWFAAFDNEAIVAAATLTRGQFESR